MGCKQIQKMNDSIRGKTKSFTINDENNSITKVKKLNPIQLFFKNISYLFRYNLKEMAKVSSVKYSNQMIECIKCEVIDELKNPKNPNIKSPEETISDLINQKASFCRYGDGEFVLLEGGGIPFQKEDGMLTKRLNEIFQSKDENIFIGIPYSYYSSTAKMQGLVKTFIRSFVFEKRNKITNLCDLKKQYYDTGCTQMYAMYENLDFGAYFEQIKKIWQNRDITIVCGKTVFDKIETNIFDCANSVEYIHAPSKDAFEEYDLILARAKKIDKNRLVIIILGPTATVLAYDLAKEGYQALDLGHIAKDYDCYVKKVVHTNQSLVDFFDPD